MKMALAQIVCDPGDVSANMAKMTRHIRDAAAEGADAIAFPELSDTGYHMAAIAEKAASWDGGAFAGLSAAAADAKIHVFAGLAERVGPHIYNSLAVLGPDGTLVAKYRKTHLFSVGPDSEPSVMTPGDRLVTCRVKDFTVGLLICYDLRFPEAARSHWRAGAEVLVIPAAWPPVRIAHWSLLAAARAVENQVYVAGVNMAGAGFGGSSCLIDPSGVVMAAADVQSECRLTATFSKQRLDEVRGWLPIKKDCRPAIYA